MCTVPKHYSVRFSTFLPLMSNAVHFAVTEIVNMSSEYSIVPKLLCEQVTFLSIESIALHDFGPLLIGIIKLNLNITSQVRRALDSPQKTSINMTYLVWFTRLNAVKRNFAPFKIFFTLRTPGYTHIPF